MSISPLMKTPGQLRKDCRIARRSLSDKQQTLHAQQFYRLARTQSFFRHARSVALYQQADGEMDPSLLLDIPGKRFYLPILRPRPNQSLWFAPYQPGQAMHKNRFGIDEPVYKHHQLKPAWGLDVIFMPLVGFDASGNRLGMGGGWYDRSLAYLRRRKHWIKPLLVGVAHECQRLDEVPVRSWDIPLDFVLTESGVYKKPTQEPANSLYAGLSDSSQ